MERDFFEDVYEVVKLIPFARVTSYGAIAAYLGAKRSARMVGYAMNSADKTSNIPAHRVVNRVGQLSGKHAFASPSMEERLAAEGIKVENDVIIDFNAYFWNPNTELL